MTNLKFQYKNLEHNKTAAMICAKKNHAGLVEIEIFRFLFK